MRTNMLKFWNETGIRNSLKLFAADLITALSYGSTFRASAYVNQTVIYCEYY